MIDGHKATTELNNDDEYGEWKIQLVMQNKCISTINFEDTRDVSSASKPAEIFVGRDTNDTINSLFDTLLQRFQKAIETSTDIGRGYTHKCCFIVLLFSENRHKKSQIICKVSRLDSKKRSNNKSEKRKR